MKKDELIITRVEFIPTEGIEQRLAPIWAKLLKEIQDENEKPCQDNQGRD